MRRLNGDSLRVVREKIFIMTIFSFYFAILLIVLYEEC